MNAIDNPNASILDELAECVWDKKCNIENILDLDCEFKEEVELTDDAIEWHTVSVFEPVSLWSMKTSGVLTFAARVHYSDLSQQS